MEHSIQLDHITLGVCYYPEHWTLVFAARTGYKDEYGRCPMRPISPSRRWLF